MPKRVVFVTNYNLMYGANKSLLSVLKDFQNQKDYEILVFTPGKGDFQKHLKSLGIPVCHFYFFSSFLYFKLRFTHLALPFLILYDILILPLLIYRCWSFKPDLIYSNTSAENLGIIISRIIKCRHISHIREFMSLDHGSFFIFGDKVKRKYINNSDGVIYVSKAVNNYVNQGFTDKKNISEVIYNGITFNSDLHNYKCNKDGIHIATIGVLQKSKGHTLAVKYLAKLRDLGLPATLHIFGEGYGQYKKEITDLIEENSLSNNVILHGFLKDPEKIFKEFDYFLMLSGNEGFGRVTVESMLAGKIVLAIPNGGSLEIIEDGKTGFFIKDFNELERTLSRLESDPYLKKQIIDKAISGAKHKFSEEAYVTSVRTFVNSIIDNK